MVAILLYCGFYSKYSIEVANSTEQFHPKEGVTGEERDDIIPCCLQMFEDIFFILQFVTEWS